LTRPLHDRLVEQVVLLERASNLTILDGLEFDISLFLFLLWSGLLFRLRLHFLGCFLRSWLLERLNRR